jgi:hypothetical protein
MLCEGTAFKSTTTTSPKKKKRKKKKKKNSHTLGSNAVV